jgi:hypothetical protein
MSPLWKKLNKQQKRNHHFPELSAGNDLKSLFWNATGRRNSLVILLFVNLLVGFFYLTQTNLTATAGFEIKNWEKEVAKLQEENKKLNLDYIRLQSMDQIVTNAKGLNLVPADNVETLVVVDNTIAMNRN